MPIYAHISMILRFPNNKLLVSLLFVSFKLGRWDKKKVSTFHFLIHNRAKTHHEHLSLIKFYDNEF